MKRRSFFKRLGVVIGAVATGSIASRGTSDTVPIGQQNIHGHLTVESFIRGYADAQDSKIVVAQVREPLELGERVYFDGEGYACAAGDNHCPVGCVINATHKGNYSLVEVIQLWGSCFGGRHG